MIQEDIAEYEILEEFSSSEWIVSEPPTRDLDTLLEDLHSLQGSAFVTQLKYIASHKAFTPINGEEGIYSVGGEQDADFENLLNAARKAVEHGYRVFILPNPKGIRTADFIFEKKGNYKMYDLKTIIGQSSVVNRLFESIGQSNRVLLNINTEYNARLLASDIKSYFEVNDDAVEVLIFKGKKVISVNRVGVGSTNFNRVFRKKYEK
ncbi:MULTISPECIES: hypothetical protein [Prevotellaceae]|uniref:hypothetical protein n=1 Tax=Prevotellaceae TaxID=171552 RepID=UPI000A6C3B83|nr:MULTISPECIES: hypothetical protein [Prevotellaceae]QVJ81406.1 hypothetical protein J4031_03175 [Xylanibacter ruminicola]